MTCNLRSFILLSMVLLSSNFLRAGDTTRVRRKDWFENPGYAHYIMGPSAIPLRKNSGYYQSHYGISQNVRYAITENINVSAGTEIASLLFRQSVPTYFYVNANYSYSFTPLIHAGGGVAYLVYPDGFFTNGKSASHYGAVFGMFTFGTLNSNITVGIGCGMSKVSRGYYGQYANYVYSTDKGVAELPVMMFAGMLRATKHFSLITENSLLPQKQRTEIPNANPSEPPTIEWQTQPMWYYSFGIRIHGERAHLDAGLIMDNSRSDFFTLGFPFVAITINFGKRD